MSHTPLSPANAPQRRLLPTGGGPLLLAALGGALSALGQQPLHLWWIVPVGLALVFLSLVAPTGSPANKRTWHLPGFGRGWIAGTMGFAVSLNWIVDPFFVEPAVTGWMAPFALVFLAGGLGLFWGVATAIATWACPRPMGRIWIAVLALLAMEELRGWIFTGFPWAMVGHAWIGTPLDQLASVTGALGLSGLSYALGAVLAVIWLRIRAGRFLRAGVATVLTGALLAAGWFVGSFRLDLPEGALAHGPAGLPIRLVQANVPQDLKWHPEHVEGFFRRHLELSAQEAAPAPALVIWPETAAPFFLDRPGDGLSMIAEAAGAPSVIGLQRRETVQGHRRYFNALAVIDDTGAPQAVYDKHHLVPFGEYIPLVGAWAESNGIGGLAARILSGYSPGPGPQMLDLGRAGRVLPLICYEAIFPRNLRVGGERPDWLLQLTNDAWFGERSGPYQHLAQMQLRAIEFGLPMIRAANTGVSAVIDARGRIVTQLGLGETGALDGRLPAALPATPYARWGDLWLRVCLWLGLLAGVSVARRRTNRLDLGVH